MDLFGSVGTRHDPLLNHNFVVSLVDTSSTLAFVASVGVSFIASSAVGAFSECTGLEMTMQPEEYKEGGRNGAVLKFPSRITWAPIVLKRGVSVNTDLWDWFNGFVVGEGKRRDGTIMLMDETQSPAFVWFFTRGLPTKYTGPALHASQNNVAIESLEITHEGLHLVPGFGAIAAGISKLGGIIG